ncbi:hypothetical protein MVEN_01802600 [Mycena venus]|uniref:Uncharacterized protein n=1 Tax=Mycena venus TaxID=2733690 RepID=A0A8H6XK61_9AGAR|nr:hypothetical protein MVEN_01802600 [Mycena venus]
MYLVKRTLSDFDTVNIYDDARRLLWPTVWSDSISEPPNLTKVIATVTPDDGWLTAMGNGGHNAEDAGDDVRSIDLAAHPELLAFSQLRDSQKKPSTAQRRPLSSGMNTSASCRTCSPAPPPKTYSGKTVGAHYVLLYLLGLGNASAPLASSRKIATSISLYKTVGLLYQDWVPPRKYAISPCVIWTSSLCDSRWQYFHRTWPAATRWFMRPWNTKEIAAAADRFGCDHNDVLARMAWCGPVPRYLFTGTPPTLQHVCNNVSAVLSGDLFAIDTAQLNSNAHHVFLVAPTIVKDDDGRRLVREDFVAEFITPAVASITFELAAHRMERLQSHLSQAFDIPATRGIAGKLVEGLMHRSLSRGVRLPTVFGGDELAATVELPGKADAFIRKSDTTPSSRPLYLRPLLPSFAPVDAMVIASPKQLGMLQTSLAPTQNRDFGVMLRIISRLQNGADVPVQDIDDVVYCLVGTTADRVQTLLREATVTLTELQKLAKGKTEKPKKDFVTEVGVSSDIVRTWIQMFRVVGISFDHQTGFKYAGLTK